MVNIKNTFLEVSPNYSLKDRNKNRYIIIFYINSKRGSKSINVQVQVPQTEADYGTKIK